MFLAESRWDSKQAEISRETDSDMGVAIQFSSGFQHVSGNPALGYEKSESVTCFVKGTTNPNRKLGSTSVGKLLVQLAHPSIAQDRVKGHKYGQSIVPMSEYDEAALMHPYCCDFPGLLGRPLQDRAAGLVGFIIHSNDCDSF